MTITADRILTAAQGWGLDLSRQEVATALAVYGNLLLRWSAKLNLTAIRDEDQLIQRHLIEGWFAAAHQPAARSILDFGSGSGVPGIPIAIYHPDPVVTLAESQQKKASFLRECVRELRLHALVHAGRAEDLAAGSFDTVWMRAVDRSQAMLPLAADLVAPGGTLCVLTSVADALEQEQLLGECWRWESTALPQSQTRVLHIARRR